MLDTMLGTSSRIIKIDAPCLQRTNSLGCAYTCAIPYTIVYAYTIYVMEDSRMGNTGVIYSLKDMVGGCAEEKNWGVFAE